MSPGTRTLHRYFRKNAQQPQASFKKWVKAVADGGPRVTLFLYGEPNIRAHAIAWCLRKGPIGNTFI